MSDPPAFYKVVFNDKDLVSNYLYPSNFIKTSKYTFYNFIPLNLYEQFKRFYNLYFLLGACLTALGDLIPIDPFVQIAPLVLVVTVTAIKQGLEDRKRHVEDNIANNIPYLVFRNDKFEMILNRNIKPGDIVKVCKGQKFPADLIILASSHKDGSCFVETSDLDGESNLKRKQAIEDLNKFIIPESNHGLQLDKISGTVQSDMPNERMNVFNGKLSIKLSKNNEKSFSLGMSQVLLRGAKLRNTEEIYGVVVYAGPDTKIMRNLKQTDLKFSTMEKQVNRITLVVLSMKFSLLFILSGLAVTFFILLTYMVPLSLFVTFELVRVGQALFMEWDTSMSSGDKPMKVKNSNLNEDLGKIEYIFSDKTGTLTRNEMTITHWYIDKHGVFDEQSSPGILRECLTRAKLDDQSLEEIKFFIKHLSICHGVLPSEENGQIVFEAQSPEELAILKSLGSNGVVLKDRTKYVITLEEFGIINQYQILNVLEFNSDRKRFSIIIRTIKGIFLFTKGADTIIIGLLGKDHEKSSIQKMEKQVDEFAKRGLRTLAVAWKQLSEDEYENFKQIYKDAEESLEDRENRVMKACEVVENQLTLLGAMAIEDRLQENVPETIAYFINAGVKIWLLTGDKQETAINIGLSSNLISNGMEILILNAKTKEECDNKIGLLFEAAKEFHLTAGCTLVVDGATLIFALDFELENKFLDLAKLCHSVICCRVTPLQKAQVVRLVKDKLKKITLSIGDGANDVSMIQAAHVGVGLMGKEGGQASRASDYSFVNFKSLLPLLAVHGRYSAMRMGKLTLYSFYKNILLILVLVWMSPFYGFSGSSMYNDRFLTLFNVIFTSLGPLCLALFEKDVSQETILNNPRLYSSIKSGLYFSSKKMFLIFLSAIWHSLGIIFCFIYLTLNGTDLVGYRNYDGGNDLQAPFIGTVVYLTVYYKIIAMVR
ncbi:phospholipid-translocating P-type ATPase [Rozella allomycis CSF55]|uniref:Phospholipid-transporting ATPase n=1 Tax=Rozella allomycis (strain CSF55) TaxID=988480 RepID=A0A4P9YNV3_ROZAC|nr:phospholipid-translocating P-type ATPase [Rozella allomycis CSF55]